MPSPYIQLIKDAGYRVFVHGSLESATYCYYTDGVRIGYAQWGSIRTHVATVHIPNRTSGTGFQYAEEITGETVKGALACMAPAWAYGSLSSIKKYRDWPAFHKADKFNSELIEI